MTVENEALAADTAADEGEFEAAFAEFSGARDNVEEVAAVEPQTEDNVENQETTDDAPKAEEAKPQDDVAKQIEELNRRNKELEHQLLSEVGRQAGLQRKLHELRTQLDAGPKPTESKREYSAKMKTLMSDFPEIAEALQEELDARLGEVRSEVKQVFDPLKQEREEKEKITAESAVKEVFPDFVEVVNSKEFVDWFQKQPAAVRSLAASDDPADAIAMLEYYGAPKANASKEEPGNTQAQEIKAKRDAALQRNVTVRNNAAAPVSPDAADDFESAFAFYSKQRERKAAQSNKRF